MGDPPLCWGGPERETTGINRSKKKPRPYSQHDSLKKISSPLQFGGGPLKGVVCLKPTPPIMATLTPEGRWGKGNGPVSTNEEECVCCGRQTLNRCGPFKRPSLDTFWEGVPVLPGEGKVRQEAKGGNQEPLRPYDLESARGHALDLHRDRGRLNWESCRRAGGPLQAEFAVVEIVTPWKKLAREQ